jgi:hypothetical protein
MFTSKKLVVTIILSIVCVVVAQDNVCMINSGRQIDEVHTKYWQFALQNTEQAAMQQVVGTWYVENVSQELGAVQRLYATYHPDGSFEYNDETCSNISCSQNQGYGQWAARGQADGSVYIMLNVSDLNRTSECTGFAATIQGNQMFTDGGNPATRVQ